MNVNDRVQSEFNKGTVTEILKDGSPMIQWDKYTGPIMVPVDVARTLTIVPKGWDEVIA